MLLDERFNEEKYRRELWEGKNYRKDPNMSFIYSFASLSSAKEFELLRLVAHGCSCNQDVDLLRRVYQVATTNILCPSAHQYHEGYIKRLIKEDSCMPFGVDAMSREALINYWNGRVIELCKRVLQEVARSLVLLEKKGFDVEDILDDMHVFPDKEVRLSLCGVCSNPDRFLIDEDDRVIKVASIRVRFEEKWYQSDISWKKEIVFLQTALEYGIITCLDGLTGNEDTMTARFESPLFEPIDSSVYFSFDRDIFWTIDDKRILAEAIMGLLKDGKLKYRKDVVKTETYLSRMRAKKENNE